MCEYKTNFVVRGVHPSNLRSDVSRRLLKWWWRIQIVVLKRVEVKNPCDIAQHILLQRLVEWERLLARYGIGGGDECESGNLGTWVQSSRNCSR